MTPEQKQHVEKIVKKFSDDVYIKYEAGAKKHGGNLWEKDALYEAWWEAVDLVTYLGTELLKRESSDKEV